MYVINNVLLIMFSNKETGSV